MHHRSPEDGDDFCFMSEPSFPFCHLSDREIGRRVNRAKESGKRNTTQQLGALNAGKEGESGRSKKRMRERHSRVAT